MRCTISDDTRRHRPAARARRQPPLADRRLQDLRPPFRMVRNLRNFSGALPRSSARRSNTTPALAPYADFSMSLPERINADGPSWPGYTPFPVLDVIIASDFFSVFPSFSLRPSCLNGFSRALPLGLAGRFRPHHLVSNHGGRPFLLLRFRTLVPSA